MPVSYTHLEDGTFDVLPKKEVIEIKKEWEKLEKNLGGIKDMKKAPCLLYTSLETGDTRWDLSSQS